MNALFCGCSLYRIITLEESMGSDLCNNSHPANVDETDESKPNNTEEDISKIGETNNDLFNQGIAQNTLSSDSGNITGKTVNPAVKSNAHLGTSNADAENNLSTHISMSVSGQARVNSNVSR